MKRTAALAALAVAALLCATGCNSAPSSAGENIATLASPKDTTLVFPPAANEAGSISGTTGLQRRALVHIPAELKGDPAVVVVLHGGLGNSAQAKTDYHWDTLGDLAKFVTVYPSGISLAWNAGNCCGYPKTAGVNDVLFLDTIIQRLISDKVITKDSKVYATGLSNGGELAYAWACKGTTRLTGLAPVAASLVNTCVPNYTPTIVAIHGSNDHNIPEDGNPLKRTKNLADSRTYSVNASVRPFLARSGCDVSSSKAPLLTANYNKPWPSSTKTTTNAKGTVVLSRWGPCTERVLVEKFVVQGAGHQWPCSAVRSGDAFDTPSRVMSATRTIAKEWGLIPGTAGAPDVCGSV